MYLLKARNGWTESILGIFDSLELAQTNRETYRSQFRYKAEPWDHYDVFEMPRNQITEVFCKESGRVDGPILLTGCVDHYTVNKEHPVEISSRYYTPGLKRDAEIPYEISEWLYEEFKDEPEVYPFIYTIVRKKVGRVYRIFLVFTNEHFAMKFKLVWG